MLIDTSTTLAWCVSSRLPGTTLSALESEGVVAEEVQKGAGHEVVEGAGHAGVSAVRDGGRCAAPGSREPWRRRVGVDTRRQGRDVEEEALLGKRARVPEARARCHVKRREPCPVVVVPALLAVREIYLAQCTN